MKINHPAIIVILLAVFMIPCTANAGKGVKLTIVNNTDKEILITPGYANCYYANDLGHATKQAPGKKEYYTERKEGGSCFLTKDGDKDIKFTIKTSDNRIFPVKLYQKTTVAKNREGEIMPGKIYWDVVLETQLKYNNEGCGGTDQCITTLFVE